MVQREINNCAMDPDELLHLRIQYVADSDPFNSFSMFPLPSRAPIYPFVYSAPLATQLGAILRILNAPQRVSYYFFKQNKKLFFI